MKEEKKPNEIKVSVTLIKVISYFLDNPKENISGYTLLKEKNIQSGTIYPLLNNLLINKWIEIKSVGISTRGRPTSIKYKLTQKGYIESIKILKNVVSQNIEKCYKK